MHLHTTMSFDAWTFGTKITPDQAYKFARGETVMVPIEQVNAQEHVGATADVPAKRSWPLDFMAVTDHSEAMGVLNQLDDPNNPLAKTPMGQQVLKNPQQGVLSGRRRRKQERETAGRISTPPKRSHHAWDVEQKAANDNYEPGKFTTFIAYEWSSMAEGKYNLHRNVFFNADHAPLPFTSAEFGQAGRSLDLSRKDARASGIDVIAIPHNGNVSGGLMYDWNDSSGRPIDEQYAQRRALNEPLTEITQNKGTSDTTPELSPTRRVRQFRDLRPPAHLAEHQEQARTAAISARPSGAAW